jgi:hypothetical protein
MAQLPYSEPEQADPVAKDVYDKAQARFRMVLNIFKITGNAPEIDVPMWKTLSTQLSPQEGVLCMTPQKGARRAVPIRNAECRTASCASAPRVVRASGPVIASQQGRL